MKHILSAILILFLTGCVPVKPIDTKAPRLADGCSKAGTVLSAEIPDQEKGYSYPFRIYLPPCYEKQSDAAYPIIYLIPGRSSGPDTWIANGAIDVTEKLIFDGKIPPTIIVTTQNTDADPQASAIFDRLIPYIESTYRVMTDRSHRAVAGGSLGGIASYRLGFQHPDMFSSVGMFGSGAISGEEKSINTWLNAMTDDNRIRVYLDCGTADPFMLERAEVMTTLLDAAGVKYKFHIGEGAHNYAYWVTNFEEYLLWITQDW
jgi:enterochelin esterase-like enzyme